MSTDADFCAGADAKAKEVTPDQTIRDRAEGQGKEGARPRAASASFGLSGG